MWNGLTVLVFLVFFVQHLYIIRSFLFQRVEKIEKETPHTIYKSLRMHRSGIKLDDIRHARNKDFVIHILTFLCRLQSLHSVLANLFDWAKMCSGMFR